MAILRVCADEGGRVFETGGGDWRARLNRMIADCPPEAPVVILIHGLRYSWRADRGCDPQTTLYLSEPLEEDRRRRPLRANWPYQLGFTESGRDDGVCIAFGWDAGRLSSLGNANVVLARFAPALVAVFETIQLAGREADCFGHSLGSALILDAIAAQPGLPVRRALLLGPAERRSRASRAAFAQQARTQTEFLHVLARANDVFDEAYHQLAPRTEEADDLPLGASGIGAGLTNWMDLQIDHPETRRWLASCGLPPTRPPERVSHWVYYSDPSAMAFYASVLRDTSPSCLKTLRDARAPTEIEARWRRLQPVIFPALRGGKRTVSPLGEGVACSAA